MVSTTPRNPPPPPHTPLLQTPPQLFRSFTKPSFSSTVTLHNRIMSTKFFESNSTDDYLQIALNQNVSGHIHTFEATKPQCRVRQNGELNNSVERFQKDAVSVCGLHGFVWTEGRFVWKWTPFQKNPDSSFCGLSVKEVTDELCALQWYFGNKMN